MFRTTRKRLLGLVAAVGILSVTGIAIAYFTSTGSGTGTATVGSTQALTLHATTSASLFPGSSATVTFTADNPSSGTEFLSTIHLASVTTDAGHSTCSLTAVTMPDVTVSQTIPSGNGQSVTAHGTITFADTGTSQNACQGAPLTLNLTSS